MHTTAGLIFDFLEYLKKERRLELAEQDTYSGSGEYYPYTYGETEIKIWLNDFREAIRDGRYNDTNARNR